MRAAPSANGQEHPRLRFAKREIAKVLEALERIDGDKLNAGLRLLQVEDELAEAREQAIRWRRSYESMQTLIGQIAGVDSAERVKRLDQAIRGWLGKA